MKHLFPIVLGLTDGIITSLVFTAGLISSSGSLHLSLILRISIGSSLIGAFSYFIAKYSELRGELIDSARQLNPASPLYLIKSRQGVLIIFEAITEASISLVSGFFGAFLTMFPEYVFPRFGLASILSAVILLGILGAAISRNLKGGWIRWSLTFVFVGASASAIGIWLNII